MPSANGGRFCSILSAHPGAPVEFLIRRILLQPRHTDTGRLIKRDCKLAEGVRGREGERERKPPELLICELNFKTLIPIF